MSDFLFVLVMFFGAGIFSLVCMAVSLAIMIRLPENNITKFKKILLIVLPALSIISGGISAFGFFGAAAAIVISVVLLLIGIFIWAALAFRKKQ